ncbi:MAG: hypothetical protein HQ402_02650 [Parcubacteria group bacterium]|nr:hypothetical protein [Parcubacteria group bacterium]
MDSIIDIYKNSKNLHHAYLVEGDKSDLFVKLCDFLEKQVGVKTKGNPDFWHGEFDGFGIDQARMIQEMHLNKAFSDTEKIFVISTDFITHEAQNSLLKIFEEPTPKTHFFILTSSSEVYLPTLKSRMVVISRKTVGDLESGDRKTAEEFLKTSQAKRISMFVEVIEEKNKQKAIEFLNALEVVFREKVNMKKISPEHILVFEQIIKCRSYLNDRSPSVKMLLEHICLFVPVL